MSLYRLNLSERKYILYIQKQRDNDLHICLKIRQSTIWYAGLLGRWDKWLVDQASDVPSIFFFHNFLQNSFQRSFQFIYFYFYCNFTKVKIKSYECSKSKRPTVLFSIHQIILGPSNTWLMRRSTQWPSVLYWRLLDFRAHHCTENWLLITDWFFW